MEENKLTINGKILEFSSNKNIKQSIIIGTAQLGGNYGISNYNSNYEMSSRIKFLDFSYKNGFHSYDTAYAYNNSHKIIGEWIHKTNYSPKIYSKIPKLNNANMEKIKSIFNLSLQQLKLQNMEGLLLHYPNDWLNNNIRTFIKDLLKNNLINSFGLSIYSENDLHEDNNINIIQAPGNIFNQEIFTSNKINNFYLNKGEIHIRSIFIQGLLLMKQSDIPKKLDELKKPLYYLHNYAKEMNIDIASLAILCVKKLMPKAKIIIGLDNIDQIKDLTKIEDKVIKNSDIDEIISFGQKYKNKLWDPRNW